MGSASRRLGRRERCHGDLTIIGVSDVPSSFKWYQSLPGQPETRPGHADFGQILDSDGTVLLCLHQWGAHEHPSLMSPEAGHTWQRAPPAPPKADNPHLPPLPRPSSSRSFPCEPGHPTPATPDPSPTAPSKTAHAINLLPHTHHKSRLTPIHPSRRPTIQFYISIIGEFVQSSIWEPMGLGTRLSLSRLSTYCRPRLYPPCRRHRLRKVCHLRDRPAIAASPSSDLEPGRA